MADKDTSAIDSDSLTDNSSDNPESKTGNSSQKSQEQLLSEYQAENKRKSEEIRELKSKISDYDERISELENISQRRELTGREEKELKTLNRDASKLAELVESQTDETSMAWKELIDKKAEKKALEIAFNQSLKRQEIFLNKKVKELNSSLKEDDDKYTVDSLAKELKKYSGEYHGEDPDIKAELAFDDWKADRDIKNSYKSEKNKFESEKREFEKFRETGHYTPRDSSLEKNLKDSKDKDAVMIDLMDRAAKLRKSQE